MKILHFADLHLGVENYGRIDPATGLSSRLGDFLAALDRLVDYALENKVDLAVFCGDAYKTREPTQTQQREFAKRINRLASAGIPVFLLTGNHDLPNAVGRATATEIFSTLAVPNIHVASRPDVHRISTPGGEVQIVALPWLRRSALLSREDTKNLTPEEVNGKLQAALAQAVADNAARLDPALPSVLAAHVWVAGAKVGSEGMMTIGQEPALLLSNVALPAFDYVALGHIHRRQVLQESAPPVVYAGSLERVDFGEEKDEKGFYVVDIAPGGGERKVSFEFHPIEGRRFLTIDVALKEDDLDPTSTVLRAVTGQEEKLDGAVVRLRIGLPASLESQLRDAELRGSLKEAHYFTITRDTRREARQRLGGETAEDIQPAEALRKWLEAQNVPPERLKVLLEYGEKLIEQAGAKE